MENKKGDIIINFKDMFYYILSRWRSILVAMLALTILAGGFKYWQDYRQYQHRLSAMEQEETVQLDETSLRNANLALHYRQAYEQQIDYNSKAPLMKINAYAAPTLTMSAVIKGEQSYTATTLYQELLHDEATYTDLAKELAWDVPCSYVMELVTLSVSYASDTAKTNAAQAVLHVHIQAPTKEDCQTIWQALNKRLDTLKATVNQTAGRHTVSLTVPAFSSLLDTNLKNTQQANISNASALRTSLQNAEKDLTDKEKSYMEDVTSEQQSDDSAAIALPTISKKYLVLGCAGGLIAFVVLYAVLYLLDKRLHSAQDFQYRYTARLFGTMPCACDKKRSRFDRWLARVFYPSGEPADPADRAALIQQQIVLAARQAGAQSVFITGGAVTRDDQQVAPIRDALEAAGITAHSGPSPLHTPASLDAMAAADAVLLVETVGCSVHNTIQEEIRLTEQLGRTLLGATIVCA